jgi:hypothetical protein
MLFIGHNHQTQQTWGVCCLHPSKIKGCWGVEQLVPNPERIFFLNQSVVENLHSSHTSSSTNLLHRQKREPVTLIVVGVVALVTALAGLTYGVINPYL